MSETEVTTETKTETPPPEKTTTAGDDQLSLDPNVEKLKADLAKAKKEGEELRKKLENDRLKKLKDSEDKEAYIKEVEAQRDEAIQSRTRVTEAVIQDLKMNAIRTEALSAGLNPKFKKLLDKFDCEGVEVETTSTGRMNVLGATSFVSRLKAEHPEMFGQKGSKINPEDPKVTSESEMTMDKLRELKKKAEKAGLRSPEYAEYRAATLKFQAK